MITQIGGPDSVGVTKMPGKNKQRVKFDKQPRISCKSFRKYDNTSSATLREYKKQQNKALATSIAVVLGGVGITVCGLLVSAFKHKP